MSPAAIRRRGAASLAVPLALALLLLAGAGGCRGGGRLPLDGETSIPPDENTPAHQACRAEARRDPAVVALYRQYNPTNEYNALRVGRERDTAEVRAYRDCLRRNGLAAPGGVEPVQPR
jgi:hypothetical protein